MGIRGFSYLNLFLLCIVGFLPAQADVLVGDRPNFNFKTVDGITVRSSQYRGQLVVLHFWSSHHPDCIAIGPHLEKIHLAYKDHNVSIIGISFDSSQTNAVSAAKQMRHHWPLVHEPLGWLSPMRSHWGIQNVPTCIVIGPLGDVVFKGPSIDLADQLKTLTVKHLLKQAPPTAPFSPDTSQAILKLLKATELLKSKQDYHSSFELFHTIHPDYFDRAVILSIAKQWMDELIGQRADKAAIAKLFSEHPEYVEHLKRLHNAAAEVESRHAKARDLAALAKKYHAQNDDHSAYFLHERVVELGYDTEIGITSGNKLREYHKDDFFRMRHLRENQTAIKLLIRAEEMLKNEKQDIARKILERLASTASDKAWGELAKQHLTELSLPETVKQ